MPPFVPLTDDEHKTMNIIVWIMDKHHALDTHKHTQKYTPGSGVFKSSSPSVVQHSALRCPASKLQKKKSISGHWVGWLSWKMKQNDGELI